MTEFEERKDPMEETLGTTNGATGAQVDESTDAFVSEIFEKIIGAM